MTLKYSVQGLSEVHGALVNSL